MAHAAEAPIAPARAGPAAAPVSRARRNAQVHHHAVLILGCIVMMAPMVVAFTSSTCDPVVIHSNGLQLGWGGHFHDTYGTVLFEGGGFTGRSPAR